MVDLMPGYFFYGCGMLFYLHVFDAIVNYGVGRGWGLEDDLF